MMQLDLTDEETQSLLKLLVEAIEADPFPLSPRVELWRAIRPMAPAPPPPARPPTPEERDRPAATASRTTASEVIP